MTLNKEYVMSIVVNIKQNSKKPKTIGLKFLNSWTSYQNQNFGIFDQAYVINDYRGEEDIRNISFVLYNKKRYGRGMSFILDDQYDMELMLNYPATQTDIHMFYKFIHDTCINFKLDTFLQEGKTYQLDQIAELENEALLFNRNLIHSERLFGLTIFGCIYPIALEDNFIKKMQSLDQEKAYDYYEDYLDSKQKIDCYYAKPLLYQASNNKIVAKYALTENVPSIFPLQADLPFGYDQNLKEDIISWNVALIVNKNGDLKYSEEIPYHDFCSILDIDTYPKFDAKHVILTLDQSILSKILSYQITQAQSELEIWLSDIRELGCKPYKIEYSTSFEDEDHIRCHIFKYKKSMLSKWYLGIVSDSGTFSEMKEYHKNTEIEDAKHILNLLKEIWKSRQT